MNWKGCLLLAAVYALAAKAGLALAVIHSNVTAVWPPTGIALAALLFYGIDLWPGVFLGALAANLLTAGTPWSAAFGIACGNTLESAVGAWLVLRYAGGARCLETPRGVLLFTFLGGLAATAISATLGVASLAATGAAPWGRFGPIWLTWWLGDMGGAFLVAPLILAWARGATIRWTGGRAAEGLLLLAALATVTTAVFDATHGLQAYKFLCLPFLVWTALRFGILETAAASLVIAGIGNVAIVVNAADGGVPDINQALLTLQSFVGVVSVTSLVLAAAVNLLRREQHDLQVAHEELERRVQERTAAVLVSQERFRSLTESANDAIITADRHGRVLSWNRGAERMFGFTEQEQVGRPLLELMPERYRDLYEAGMERLARTGKSKVVGQTLEFHGLRRDGREFPLEISISSWRSQGEDYFAAIIRDTTERKRASAAVKASEDRFRLLVQGVRDYAIFMLNPEGRVASWNEGAERIKGYKAEDVLGRDFAMFYTPEDREKGIPMAILRQAAAEGRAEVQGWRVRKDGSRFWAGEVLTALRDETGRLAGFAKVLRDMTTQQRAEQAIRERTEDLMRSNAELEMFATVASHDLQEPLRKIQLFGDRLIERAAPALDEQGLDFLQRMRQSAARMSQLIDDLLAYSRVTMKAQPFQQVDLTELANEALRDLEARVERTKARVTVEPLPSMRGDPGQLRRLFLNLLGNSLKFTREAEPPDVTIRGERLPDGFVEVRVSDNGIGFDEKYLGKMFKPFQRLQPRGAYEGSGMGLAICRKIVERHGGTIAAQSAPGKGATFVVRLPA